jgi:hypothetical protein
VHEEFKSTRFLHGMHDERHWPQDSTDSAEEHGSEAIYLCGGGRLWPEDLKPKEENVVMIGLIPCRVLSEVHLDGRRVMSVVAEETEGQSSMAGCVGVKEVKHARVVTSAGHEVIRPGYTSLTSDRG